MRNGCQFALTTALMMSIAASVHAEATGIQLEIYGAEADYGYEPKDDLNPFRGYGGELSYQTELSNGANVQFDLSYRNTPPRDEADYDFNTTTLATFYDLDFVPGDVAAVGGIVSLTGYEGQINDAFWLAGANARFSPTDRAIVDFQAGILNWFSGEYEPVDPEIGFVNARLDFAFFDRFAVTAELGLIESFGDIGDSEDEDLSAFTYGVGVEAGISDRVTGFIRYAGFDGGWGFEDAEDADSSTVSIGARINFAGNQIEKKRRLMNFEAISWIRQDGW